MTAAPVTGQRAAPPSGSVFQQHPHHAFIDIGRIERPAVPFDHLLVLFVARIEHRLEKIHETISAADILRRAAPRTVRNRLGVVRLGIVYRFGE